MSSTSFPGNVVDVLKTQLARTPSPEGPSVTPSVLFGRPLRMIDPDMAIGVFEADWAPVDFEIGEMDPGIARYTYQIQCLIKHMNEEEGRALHSSLSKSIRLMLYRDTALRVALSELSDSDMGRTERTSRWGVARQRFLSNELKGTFIFMSSLDLWVEVQTAG